MYIQDILTSLKVSRSKKGEKKDFFMTRIYMEKKWMNGGQIEVSDFNERTLSVIILI